MKTLNRSHRLLLVCATMAATAALAQGVPATVSFTGNLTNSGAPVSGTHSFIFSLYDSATAGTGIVVWTETQGSLTVTSGLVYADLGAVTPFTPTILNGAPLFLEVRVDGNALTPRLAFQSVAYAMRAAVANTSETLGALTPADVVTVAGAQTISGAKTFSSPIAASISGNAATVTNGLYSTSTYSDPAWLTSLAGSKITGAVANATNAVNASTVTNGLYSTGAYADPAWLTSLAGAKITGTVANATNATTAASANAVAANVITPSDLNAAAGPAVGQVPSKATTDTFTWVTPVTSVGATSPLSSTGGAAPSISLPVCAEGQILKVVGGVWACAADLNRLVNVIQAGAGGSIVISSTTVTSVYAVPVTVAAGDSLSIIGQYGYWGNGTTGGVACTAGQCTQVYFYVVPCYQASGSGTWTTFGQNAFFWDGANDVALGSLTPRRGGLSVTGDLTLGTAGTYQVGICAYRTAAGVAYMDVNVFYPGVLIIQRH